ncbi:PCZ2.3 [Planococcus antarcticus DSM 14505]|uniref:PCZ2.3 n=1 Tax=Planococcus antarcticus DSM 14505 TaxID=1185653 RepID=A0AA87LRG4_9BACL|nr:MerR family transcriptional regulator [Planococcus antarcticus]EIM05339.1 PCZ2.3 [Planococcus antarcticus DSM 14505]
MTVYSPAQVCEELGIQDSTLRKYSLLLDKEGIVFERHKNNRRKYTETHVVTLKRTLELMHNDDITLEKAINQACNELKAHPFIEDITVTEKPLQRNNSDTTALLIEEIQGLKQQLNQQEERQKERDSMFVEVLEDLQKEVRSMREQQQLPRPEEKEDVVSNHPPEPDIHTTDTIKKKGFFARLFK